MKFDIEIAGKQRRVESVQTDDKSRWLIDGQPIEADAVEMSPGTYLILLRGKSMEVRLEAAGTESRAIAMGREYQVAILDLREWKKNRGRAAEAQGRQQVVAPMPGKIIRILVKTGDEVPAGQGLLVVEAMKMQNEIRAPKSGIVERLSVIEGQTVNAGQVVAVVS
ncbi:MAG: biotin/lipoyl-containing protein [Candidatus Acidiferrales bacterium]